MLCALLHAACFALAFPPFDIWPLAFLAAAPLAWIGLRARTTRAAVVIPWVVMSLMWLWLNRWIIPVTVPGYPVLGCYMSLYPVLFIWIVRRISRHPTLGRLPMAVVVPAVWTSIEYLRGDLILDGYPWFHLGQPMIAWLGFVQSAGLLGTYFISSLAAMVSGAIIDCMLARASSDPARPVSPRWIHRGVAGAAIVLLLNLVWGWTSLRGDPGEGGSIRILAIQTNLPQDNKMGWSEEAQARDIPAFIDLTRRAFAACDPRPDLVVWPETMVPGLGFDPATLRDLENFGAMGDAQRIWPLTLMALADELRVPMLIGSDSWIGTRIVPLEGTRIRLEKEHNYNSAFLIQPGLPLQRYDKFFLTPFGETMPYISSWPWLETQLLALGAKGMTFELDSSPQIRRLSLRTARGNVTLGTPICFEDTVAHFCRRLVQAGDQPRADVLVNISNDGWYNSSLADRKLHAQIARLRCIENGIPMVRAVNTGYSIAIDRRGRIIGAVGGRGYGVANQEGWLIADVPPAGRPTLYGRIGELWPQACLAATMLGLGLTFIGSRTKAGAG